MTGTVSQQTQFAVDCATVTRLLKAQDGDEALAPDEEHRLATALANVTTTLPRLLGQRVRDAGQDPEDIAQEAFERFVKAVRAGRVDEHHSPAGYLVTIAMNIARDGVRRPDTIPLAEAGASRDTREDQVTRMIDSLASAETVRRALERALAERDQMVLEVVPAWLDLAHHTGKQPTSREVALYVGISKTTVANVLGRFRKLLQDPG
ncbi:sigma-70 family RNA polymerase sigma factor [Streptomyces sp. NPDC006997]|uniref:sigma-70 family RNA polymerase sigma factor n=1 Tax=Streptomyces sp. NPDC006997 TaxID=3155356 RepID=UPI0033F6808E